MHPRRQRVGLLNVKPHHQLAARSKACAFQRAVVVGVVVSERLNVIKLSLSGTPVWLVRLAAPTSSSQRLTWNTANESLNAGLNRSVKI